MATQEQSVECLFAAALELPPAQRSEYLDSACKGRTELRQQVDGLLRDNELAGSFMGEPLFGPHKTPLSTPKSPSTTGDLPAFAGTGFRFAPGDVIAERFVVVRFIARGGMGEVYEVEDGLLHGTHVALKIIRSEIAADAGSSHRFEQEVILARKVNHANLCPIYEIFRCEQPAPPFLFLTMKLLHGETLAIRLRCGKIPSEEATEICTQLIAGVAAIHDAGVIHRDLKPNNIMLEQSGTRLGASIMDFGLARLHESEVTVLKTGMIAGTPGYLAPELFQGQRPTQATDIFALGVVLHQVLTGERPLEARNGVSVIPAPSLRSSAVQPNLIDAVEGFLSDDPERRCQSFEQIRSSSYSYPGSSIDPRVRTSLLTRRRFMVSAAASACGLAGIAKLQQDNIYNLFHPLPSKRFVALLTWPPLSDNRVRPMVTGLIDAMADQLSRAEAIDHNFYIAAEKNPTPITAPAQLNEVRESLGANLVLGTTATTRNNHVQVGLHVLDPVTFRSLRSRNLTAPLDQLFSLPLQAVQAASKLLDVPHFTPDDKANRGGTGNAEAFAAFQQAELAHKQVNDTGLDLAIDKYKQALEIDPHYALAQAQLGWAYLRLYGLHEDGATLALARDNCESAIAIDPDLVEAHLGLAWYFEQTGEREAASREMTKALTLDPLDVHTLNYKARFYADNGHYSQAEETFRRILELRPNYWLARSEYGVLLYNEGKYNDALMQFREARVVASKNALVFANIGAVYLQLGKIDEAIQNCKSSFSFQPTDTAAQGLAAAFRVRRQYSDAISYAQTAVKLNPADSTNWLELGDSYSATGKFNAEAIAAYKGALKAEDDELQTQQKNALGWMLLALYRAKTGDTASAYAMNKAESFNAVDMTSQLIKIRTLEVLGRRDEALSEIALRLNKGATVFQFQTMPDLGKLRTDPRYLKIVGAIPSGAENVT
jgi:eukaryotic-like serine/threonine-protein kinase